MTVSTGGRQRAGHAVRSSRLAARTSSVPPVGTPDPGTPSGGQAGTGASDGLRAGQPPGTAGQSERRRTAELGPRFDQALVLASDLHRGQERKGRGTPYISHLLAVCSIVLDNGGDEDEAIAALLHDSAEDQGGQATLDIIKARFGPRVAGIVAACSDTFERPKPPALERKRAYLDSDGTSCSVLLVSAADKVHNLRSTLDDYDEIGTGLWRRFSCRRPSSSGTTAHCQTSTIGASMGPWPRPSWKWWTSWPLSPGPSMRPGPSRLQLRRSSGLSGLRPGG